MNHLYYYPGNASFAPHVVMREAGLALTLHRVDRESGALKSAEYLKLNPAGRIPAFVSGDLVLFEAAAICLHLSDNAPDAGLAPPVGTPERAHFYKWLMFLTNTIQPDFLMFYYSDRYTTDSDCTASVKQAAENRLNNWFDIVEDALPEGGGFLGERYSILDIYLVMLMRWGRGLTRPPKTLPRLGALAGQVLARPAVITAIEAEDIEGEFLG